MRASSVILLALSVGPAVGIVVQAEKDKETGKGYIEDKEEKPKKDNNIPQWSYNVQELAANAQTHLDKVRDNFKAQMKTFNNQMKTFNNLNPMNTQLQKDNQKGKQKQSDAVVWDISKPAAEHKHATKKTSLVEDKADAEAEKPKMLQHKKIQNALLGRNPAQFQGMPQVSMNKDMSKQTMMRKVLDKQRGHKSPRNIPRHGVYQNAKRQANQKHAAAKAYKKSLNRAMNLQHQNMPKDLLEDPKMRNFGHKQKIFHSR